ncbi:MAG: helix-turn-helix domain-containing protein [Lachnospiraceae bacterium]|nr:helix-turn-helix domain-containing protein [Lachnospiraceae bacterium]
MTEILSKICNVLDCQVKDIMVLSGEVSA